MLTKEMIDEMLEELKQITDPAAFSFPAQNELKQMQLVATKSKRRYQVDVNRKGFMRISKCSFQKRASGCIVLLRLDIDGPEHQNPDGTWLSRNHLHIYCEGWDDRWAAEIPSCFVDPKDLITTLINFLEYCKVNNYKELILQGTVL